MQTKTSLKNRLVSALLALAMVASFLPEGLIPRVYAAPIDSAKVTLSPDGAFSVVLSGLQDQTATGNYYYALVPDVGLSDGNTLSDRINSNAATGIRPSGSAFYSTFVTRLSGVGATNSTGYISTVYNGRTYTTTERAADKFTISKAGNGNDGASLTLPAFSEVRTALAAFADGRSLYFGNGVGEVADVTKLAAIPYIFIFWAGAGTYTSAYTVGRVTYSPGGLLVEPSITVTYKYNPDHDPESGVDDDYSYSVSSDPDAYWSGTEDGEASVVYTITNATKDTVYLTVPDNDLCAFGGDATFTMDGDPWGWLDGWAAVYTYAKADGSDADMDENNYIVIEPGESVTMTVEYNSESYLLSMEINGSCELTFLWSDDPYNLEDPETAETATAYLEFITSSTEWEGGDISFTIPEIYTPSGLPVEDRQVVLTWKDEDPTGVTTFNPNTGGNTTIRSGADLAGDGAKIEYFVCNSDNTAGSQITGDYDLTDGTKIIIRYTPPTGLKTDSDYDPPYVTVTAGTTKINVNINVEMDEATRYSVSGKVAAGSGTVTVTSSASGATGSGNSTTDSTAATVSNLLPGASATLTATPSAGYKFKEWDDGNTNASRAATVNDKNPANISLAATFEKIGLKWQPAPSAETITYGASITDKIWHAVYDGTGTTDYPIKYTVTDKDGLDAYLDFTCTNTTGADATAGGITVSNKTGQYIPAGTYTIKVKACDGDGEGANEIEGAVTITVNKKQLPNPVLTRVSNVNPAGAANGVAKYTEPAEAYPSVVSLTLIDASGNAVTGKTVPTSTGNITGLAPGKYRVQGTLSDTDNYEWETPVTGTPAKGNSEEVEITEPGVNPPSISGGGTYEKNTALTGRTASFTFNFNVGDWQTLTGLTIGGTTIDLTASGVTVTQPSSGEKTGKVVIDAAYLDTLSLTNGTKTVVGTFSRDNATPATKTASDDLLNVQTTYTVSFNVNGGTAASAGNPSIANVVTKTTDAVPEFKYGSISNNAPTRTGYTFAGWNTDQTAASAGTSSWASGATANYYPAGTKTSTPAVNLMDSSKWNTTVYAVWTINKYTVTFVGNGTGVTNVPDPYTDVSYDSTISKPGTDPSRPGYSFAGWYKEVAGTNVWTFGSDKVTSNISLYAKWTAHTYTVDYNANGHGTAPSTVHSLTAASPTFTAASAITADGWTFQGWNTESGGGGVAVAAGATGVDIKNLNNPTTPTLPADKTKFTLYAIWTEDEYTVTYNANGHGTAPDAHTGLTAANPTFTAKDIDATGVDGYTFKGWNTKSNGSGTAVAVGATGNIKTLNGNVLPAAGGGITLYAIWEGNKYTVKFDGNAVSGQTVSGVPADIPNVAHGGKISAPTAPTSDGYKFEGWYKEDTCTNAWVFGTDTVTDNITLHAKWTANVVKVTTKLNGSAVSGRKITLYDGTTATAFSDTTDSSGVVTFTAVPAKQYNIYDELTAGSPKATGVTVTSAAGSTGTGDAAAEVRYYDVEFVDVKSNPDHGSYTGFTSPAVPTKQNIIINSTVVDRRKVDPLPGTTPDTNYALNSWSVTTNTGTNPNTASATSVGAAPAATATSWTPGRNTSYNQTQSIKLKPVFNKTGASLTVTVTLDGQKVADGTTVTLGTKTATTTGGVATFSGLAATNYTLSCTPVGIGQQAVTITGTTDGSATLNYYTVTAQADATPTAKDVYVRANDDTSGTKTSQVFLETKNGNSGNVAKVVASPEAGYKTPASWSLSTVTYKADGTANAATTSAGTGGSPSTIAAVNGTITATASFAPIAIKLSNGTGSVTFGNTITALDTDPKVTYEATYTGDTVTYEVQAADNTYGSTARTINGITLTPTASGWTVSGTPTSVTGSDVVFNIKVTSSNGTSDTATVTIKVSKALIDTVDVTDIKIPTPGTKPSDKNTADLPTTDPGYVNNSTGGTYGDESATVTWSPTDDPFKYGVSYTATVVVKPDGNHEFAETVTTNATPEAGGGDTVTKTNVTPNANGTVTVTYTFPAVYQLVYSPNGGSGGTQPAAQDIKLNDKITIAANPGYTRSGWKGNMGWAVTSGGGVDGTYGTFGATNVTVSQTMLNRATDGVITLYYVWQSSAMATPEVELDAVYNMDNTQWKTGDVVYWTRTYKDLVAPGVINVTGDEVALENLTYTLEKIGSGIDPNTYFKVDVDSTTHIATMSMKDGVKIPDVGTYTFTVKVENSDNGQTASATYTLNVRPIELDHSALSALTAPVKGAAPVTAMTKTDGDSNWSAFYNTSSASWSPNHNPYKKGQTYTATVTLTPVSTNYIFVEPDDNSSDGAAFTVGTETVIKPSDDGWSYELTKTKVTMTRVYPLTDIEVEATLNATAWNTLTVTNFKAYTESDVNLYYLIYDSAQTFANAAAVKAAYTAATAGSGGVIAKGTQANVSPSSGTASWSGAISVTDNGVVGGHTYYLYVVAETTGDDPVLAKNDDDATTYKKLTVSINDFGSVSWTGNSSPVNTTTTSKVISMMKDNTTGVFTPSWNTTQFGFVKWTLDGTDVPAANLNATSKAYTYADDDHGNDEELKAIFHRKINNTFTIDIADNATTAGAKDYTPNYAGTLKIGSVALTAGGLPNTSEANYADDGGIKYQWYENVSTSGTWTAIPGATDLVYTNPANTYPGAAFKLRISYTDPDNGGDESYVEAQTGAQVQKLATPSPTLSRVEVTDTTSSFLMPDGTTPVDKSTGGLHLTFPAIDQDLDAGNNTPVDYYLVTLTGNGKTLTEKITADGRDGDYYFYWPAKLADVKPGEAFTVSVKAISKGDDGADKATNGWKNSEPGTDEVTKDDGGAGYRELTMDMLEVKTNFTDKVFNGLEQDGGGAFQLQSKYNDPTGVSGIGTITINYDNGDGNSKTAKKKNVNLTQEGHTDPKPSDGTNPDHDYDIYVSVAQGTLYLKLDSTQFTGENTKTVDAKIPGNNKVNTGRTASTSTLHADWEIVQAPATLSFTTGSFSGLTETTKDIRPGPYVTYNTKDSNALYNDANKRITGYYDITYTVVSSPSTNYPKDKVLTETDLQTFKADVAGDYVFMATATYKTEGEGFPNIQFQADVSECSNTFKFTTNARSVKEIILERFEAVNGTAGNASDTGTNKTEDRPVIYGTSVDAIAADEEADIAGRMGYYDASDADKAKQMSLEGLRITINYDGGDPDIYVVGDGKTLPTGATWTSSVTNVADSPAITDSYLTFKGAGVGKNFKTELSFTYSGVTSKNSVTYTMERRALDWKVTGAPEKIWDNKPDAANEHEVTTKLEGDDVDIALSGYSTRKSVSDGTKNSDVGKDKTARADVTGTTADNSDVTGDQKAFYKRGTETPGTASIKPSLVTKLNVNQPSPSAETSPANNNSVSNTKYKPSITNKEDEKKVTTNWSLTPSATWEAWDDKANDGAGGWVRVDDIFRIDTVYRATVTVQADTNHHLTTSMLENGNYTINDKRPGEYAIEDLDEWNNREENKIKAVVNESSVYFHPEWLPDEEVVYHNIVTFTFLFHTYETPTLQFSDQKTSWNKVAATGTHHVPGQYVHHNEVVTEGAGGMTYLIAVNASVKDIFGAQVILTNQELLDAGASLRIVQGNGTNSTATSLRTSTPTDPMRKLGGAGGHDDDGNTWGPYEADKDLIIYELTIPSSVTAKKGLYHLEFQAMGSTSYKNKDTGKVDVAKSYYTFTLEVLEKQQPPTIVSGGGGGTTVIETPIVTYRLSSYGFTSDLTAEKLSRKGAKPSFVPKVTAVSGLKFVGWSEVDPATLKDGTLPTLVDPLTFAIDSDKVFYAVYERAEGSHSHYVIGFPDGTFGPDNPITRGQVATIIARACLENFIEGADYGNPGNYTDISGHWAASAIAFCSMKGVFTGYEDGTFRPDRYISRQELATVVARMAGVEINKGLPFTDTDEISDWALNGVYTNYAHQWVKGYTDESFRPLQNITRAETVKVFNGYLNRGTDKEGLHELHEYIHEGVASNNTESSENNEYMTWPDVPKTHWAYYDVIEAANDHNFRWRDTSKVAPPEDWYEAFIDEVWRYQDDENDGADDVGRDSTLPMLTVTYVVKSNGVTWDSITEEVQKFSSPDPAKLPKAEPSEGFRFAGWSDVDPDTGEINIVRPDPTAFAVEEDKTYYAIFEPDVYILPQVTITYVVGDHGSTDALTLTETIDMWASPTLENYPKITAHEGWSFIGWSETDPATGVITLTDPTDHPALEDSVFYAVYEPIDPNNIPTTVAVAPPVEEPPVEEPPVEEPPVEEPPVEEPPVEEPPVEEPPVEEPPVEEPPVEEPPVEEPPVEEPPVEEPPVEEPPVEEPPVEEPPVEEPPVEEPPVEEPPVEEPPVEEPPVEYARYHYLNGYTDGTFRPDTAFTRAAVATVIANLMGYDPNETYEGADFDDLYDEMGAAHWATNAIAFCVSEGIMNGYTDDTFRPDNAISRQEFAVILCRLAGETESGELPFVDADDIAGWAMDSVYTAYAKGWINGYDDGTFLPERNVTRAEAVKMFNGYLGRLADRESIESQTGYTVWEDVPQTHWAYFEIIEASNDWLW